MMTNNSAVRDSRARRTRWGLAAVAVIVCVLACVAASADVEYVDMCDYFPLVVGNTWEADAIWIGGSYTLEMSVVAHYVVNAFDVWRADIADRTANWSLYMFYVDGQVYRRLALGGGGLPQELNELPALTEYMEPWFLKRYPIGVPLGSVTAYRGTLAEMLSLCLREDVESTDPLDSQLDAVALVHQNGLIEVFAYGIGLVHSWDGHVIIDAGMGPWRPVSAIVEGGCPNPLFLTSTNLGEVWEAGTAQTVTWQRDTEVAGPDVRIGLHKGAAFIDWIVRKTANDGEYAWLIPPDLAPGDDYRLRIQSFTDSSIVDYSDGTFSITSPALALTVPNGGEALQAVDTQTIAWLGDDPAVGADVRLGLHRGATFVGWITRRTSNDGEFNWTIPDDLPAAANYRLRIQSFTDSAIRDFSDRRFAIVR